MYRRLDPDHASRHIAAGHRVLDVLDGATYAREHLPRAESHPLAELTESLTGHLDRAAPVLVYSHDATCDLADRAAARLVLLGFTDVSQLLGGKLAWFSEGLAIEGVLDSSRRVGTVCRDVLATVRLDGRSAPAVRERSVLLNDDGVVLAMLDPASRSNPSRADVTPAPLSVKMVVAVLL